MKHLLLISIFLTLFVGIGFSGIVPDVFAASDNDTDTQKFISLVGIPYVNTSEAMSLPTYVNALYFASISIAAFLAVIRIIFAGVKYMLTDVVTAKGEAKKDIQTSLLGLIIVISAVLILKTINPQLIELDVLNGPPVGVDLGQHDRPDPDPCVLWGVDSDNNRVCETRESTVTSDSDVTGNPDTSPDNLIGSEPYPDPTVLITQYGNDLNRYVTQTGLINKYDQKCLSEGKGSSYMVEPFNSSSGPITFYCNPNP